MIKRLQVFKDGNWQYVFCYDQTNRIIATKDYKKALQARDYDFFCNKYGNNIFRVIDPRQLLNEVEL